MTSPHSGAGQRSNPVGANSLIRPPRLRAGDTVAAISLSWGGPGAIPHRYEAGKRQFEAEFGCRVIETKHALADPAWIAANPQARADDLMEAFADPEICAVISTIGGEDSIRILPHIDLGVLRANPKIFMGFSDTTVTHLACFAAGLGTFYGPSFMAGFAENDGLHRYLADSVRRTLFSAEPVGEVRPNTDGWTVEYLEWTNSANQSRRRALTPSSGWRWLQGSGSVRGPLLGGCLEVLDWLRGTPVWPPPAAWDGAVLFFETSEEAPPPSTVKRWLRCHGALGVLQHASALLFGRPGGHRLPVEDHEKYDRAILAVVRDELALKLPVVTGMDFGHTDPYFVLPYGARAEVDCDARRFSILEAAVR